MSVRQLGVELAGRVYALLSEDGFRKRGMSIWRERETIVETHKITGSRWNSGNEPWKFYLEVSMRIADLALPTKLDGQALSTTPLVRSWGHSAGRYNCVNPEGPLQFEVTSNSLDRVAHETATRIREVSSAFIQVEAFVRREASVGNYCPLRVAIKAAVNLESQQRAPEDAFRATRL